MIEIFTLPVGSLQANAHVISNGEYAYLIDPGDEPQKIEQFLLKKKIKLSKILLTHAHFDHCNAVKHFQDGGVQVVMHTEDLNLVNTDGNLARYCGVNFNRFKPDILVADGDKVDFFGKDIAVIHTPGHTDGSVCYLIDNVLFSGDTLFHLSVGRVDFPTGSAQKMRKSLKLLCKLDENIVVYCGHGEQSSIGFEKKNNPYVEL